MKAFNKKRTISSKVSKFQHMILDDSYVFLGVSICSRTYSSQTLTNILNWCETHCKGVFILVADEPQAYTFMASKNIKYETALDKALEIGRIKTRFIQKIVFKHGYSKIQILNWSHIKNTSQYLNIYNYLIDLYQHNYSFKKDVIAQIINRNSALPTDFNNSSINYSNFNVASIYILCELSAIIYFHKYFRPSCHFQISPFAISNLLNNLYKNRYTNEAKMRVCNAQYIELTNSLLEGITTKYTYFKEENLANIPYISVQPHKSNSKRNLKFTLVNEGFLNRKK